MTSQEIKCFSELVRQIIREELAKAIPAREKPSVSQFTKTDGNTSINKIK